MTGGQGGQEQFLELRLSCQRVRGEQLGGQQLADLFTPAERALSGARPRGEGFAGRLAAKRAVAEVLGADASDHSVLRRIRITPAPRLECRDPARCGRGHPPAVTLEPGPGMSGNLVWIDVSVSHDAGEAFAASLAVLRWPARNANLGGEP